MSIRIEGAAKFFTQPDKTGDSVVSQSPLLLWWRDTRCSNSALEPPFYIMGTPLAPVAPGRPDPQHGSSRDDWHDPLPGYHSRHNGRTVADVAGLFRRRERT